MDGDLVTIEPLLKLAPTLSNRLNNIHGLITRINTMVVYTKTGVSWLFRGHRHIIFTVTNNGWNGFSGHHVYFIRYFCCFKLYLITTNIDNIYKQTQRPPVNTIIVHTYTQYNIIDWITVNVQYLFWLSRYLINIYKTHIVYLSKNTIYLSSLMEKNYLHKLKTFYVHCP